MSSRKDKWFLVQLSNDAYQVVNYRAVDPACDSNIGSVVTITRTQDTATIIGSSRDRKVLEQQIAPPQPPGLYEDSAAPGPGPGRGPSLKHEDMAQEERDFSASEESDWAPSNEHSTDDDDGDKKVETKVKRIRRSYANKRTSEIKPSHRADAVVMSLNTNRKRRLDQTVKRYEKPRSYRKQTHSNRESENKSAPDSTRNSISPMVNCLSMMTPTVNTVNVNVQDILNMKQCFDELFKILNELKPAVNSMTKETETESLEETQEPIPQLASRSMVKNERSVVENITQDFDEYEYRSDESHRSDDNILITNKYHTVHNKILSEHDKNMKKKESTRKSKDTTSSNQNPAQNTKMVADSQDKMLESSQPQEWIPIGSGKTLMHKDQYRQVNWKSYTIATRTLLLALFPRKILATHSMTGKRSPAFANKPAKMCLDPKIVSDVIIEITERFKVKENLVRSIITTKCADECKMLKMRMKRKTLNTSKKDQENLSPDDDDCDEMTNQSF